jgi:hypothetical protein
MAHYTQDDSGRPDAECKEKPSDAGIICDVGRPEDNGGYGDGNPGTEALNELTLEKSAKEQFFEQWRTDATEQNEHSPPGRPQPRHRIKGLVRIAGRAEEMDERYEHQYGKATRHNGPSEADEKIEPPKPEPEVSAHLAGAVAMTGDDAGAEEPRPKARLRNNQECQHATWVPQQEKWEDEEERETERDQ